MTIEDIGLLDSESVRRAIEANLTIDPTRIALSKGIENAALVASAVKYLRRAQSKLPSYYSARAIIPPLAYEQSSSEAVAALKHYSGKLCIDLTCGLGVDSLHFAHHFERVIAVERDPVLAEVAEINFRRLGIDNVEVVNLSAEEFLDSFTDSANLIYADPDRRSEAGRKLVNPADCSPNVVDLMPRLLEKSDLVVIKNSPLFDVYEIFRLFATSCQKVEVISSGGEAKEILVELSKNPNAPIIKATSCEAGSYEQPYSLIRKTFNFQFSTFNYIVVPDASLRVAHLVTDYFEAATPNGYAFLEVQGSKFKVGGDILGKIYPITAMMPYNAKAIRQALNEMGIKKANIHTSDIDLELSTICRQIGVSEGGTAHLFFTTIVGQRWCVISKL